LLKSNQNRFHLGERKDRPAPATRLKQGRGRPPKLPKIGVRPRARVGCSPSQEPGGGTSRWNLLDQAIAHDASEIHWVSRSLRWFYATNRTQHTLSPSLSEVPFFQSMGLSREKLSASRGWVLQLL
jgi:hypothetical protein